MPETTLAFRCSKCNKLLANIKLSDGKVDIKCKCGTLNTITAKPEPVEQAEKKFIYNAPYQNRLDLHKK